VRREAEVLDYKVPRGAIYIGRPMPDLPGTKWANPLKLRRHF
jgi:hypothetical protein